MVASAAGKLKAVAAPHWAAPLDQPGVAQIPAPPRTNARLQYVTETSLPSRPCKYARNNKILATPRCAKMIRGWESCALSTLVAK